MRVYILDRVFLLYDETGVKRFYKLLNAYRTYDLSQNRGLALFTLRKMEREFLIERMVQVVAAVA